MLTVSVRDGDRPGWLEDAIQFLAAEAASDHAGRTVLLTKLSEALFVETLRRWMTALPAEHISWLAGARDGVVGRALALLHRQPSRRWTLDALARDTDGLPRAVALTARRDPARHDSAERARSCGARGVRVGGRVQPGVQARVRTTTGSLSPRREYARHRNSRTCPNPPNCTKNAGSQTDGAAVTDLWPAVSCASRSMWRSCRRDCSGEEDDHSIAGRPPKARREQANARL